MKLKLISPCASKLRINGKTPRQLSGVRSKMPPWSLCCIAAVTPDSWEISIEDEMMDEIVYDDNPDLVVISIIAAASSSRAYELGDYFRQKGIPVVMGGIHASATTEETLKHADAVVVGEAEGIWPKVLDDCVNKNLKGVYKNNDLLDLKGLPRPRLDLLKHKDEYDVYQYVQPARGCMYHCEFCSTTAFWKKLRTRPVDEVIDEMKYLDPNKPIMVMDEFVGCDRKYYKELLEKMIPLNLKYWSCQTGVRIAEDIEMLDLMQKAGCKYVFLGLESPNIQSLRNSNKSHNDPNKYVEVAKRFHDRGIMIQGGFVFGLDSDDLGTFKRVYKLVKKTGIEEVQLNLVYPYPGTPLREHMKKENRVTSDDFDNYIFDGVNFIPKSMTQDELNTGYNWLLKKCSSMSFVVKNVIKKILKGRLMQAYGCYLLNKGTIRSMIAVRQNGIGSKSIRYPNTNSKTNAVKV